MGNVWTGLWGTPRGYLVPQSDRLTNQCTGGQRTAWWHSLVLKHTATAVVRRVLTTDHCPAVQWCNRYEAIGSTVFPGAYGFLNCTNAIFFWEGWLRVGFAAVNRTLAKLLQWTFSTCKSQICTEIGFVRTPVGWAYNAQPHPLIGSGEFSSHFPSVDVFHDVLPDHCTSLTFSVPLRVYKQCVTIWLSMSSHLHLSSASVCG